MRRRVAFDSVYEKMYDDYRFAVKSIVNHLLERVNYLITNYEIDSEYGLDQFREIILFLLKEKSEICRGSNYCLLLQYIVYNNQYIVFHLLEINSSDLLFRLSIGNNSNSVRVNLVSCRL